MSSVDNVYIQNLATWLRYHWSEVGPLQHDKLKSVTDTFTALVLVSGIQAVERLRGPKRPGSSIQLNAGRGLCCPHISSGDTRPHFVTLVPPPFNVMGSNFACNNPRNIKHPKPDIDRTPYHLNPTAVYILQGTNIGYRFHLRLLHAFTLQMRQTMCAAPAIN